MNDIEIRILRLIEWLLYNKTIGTAAEFCEAISMQKQTLTNIKAGKQYFTSRHIKSICAKYNVNANWIFSTQKNVFNELGSIEINDFPTARLATIRQKENDNPKI